MGVWCPLKHMKVFTFMSVCTIPNGNFKLVHGQNLSLFIVAILGIMYYAYLYMFIFNVKAAPETCSGKGVLTSKKRHFFNGANIIFLHIFIGTVKGHEPNVSRIVIWS